MESFFGTPDKSLSPHLGYSSNAARQWISQAPHKSQKTPSYHKCNDFAYGPLLWPKGVGQAESSGRSYSVIMVTWSWPWKCQRRPRVSGRQLQSSSCAGCNLLHCLPGVKALGSLQTIFDLISEIGSLRALSHPPNIFLPSDDRLPRWFMAHVLHSPGNEKKSGEKKEGEWVARRAKSQWKH